MSACQRLAESDMMRAEIRPKTFDSLGGSLTSKLLSGEAERNAEASAWSQRNSGPRQRVETSNDKLAAQKHLNAVRVLAEPRSDTGASCLADSGDARESTVKGAYASEDVAQIGLVQDSRKASDSRGGVHTLPDAAITSPTIYVI